MRTENSTARGKRGLAARRLRLRRVGLHEAAADRLRKLIVRGDLMPGDAINEAALSGDLGVSRTPLREAIKLLAAEGLLELRRNRSPVVASLHADEVNELFETVGAVERAAAELAAVRATPRDLQRLVELQERMERQHQSGSLREYFDTNQQVHAFIVECARNSVLKATHAQLLARAERARFLALFSQSRWDESIAEHRQILQALRDADGPRAGELLGRHVRRTGEVCAETLPPRAGPDGGAERMETELT
jgi:DNA-binding GntR family transcriptional regulator